MQLSLSFLLICTVSPFVHAASSPWDFFNSIESLFTREDKCPSVWDTISEDLTEAFRAGGQCTGLARAAIRFAFHDAGTFSHNLPFKSPAAGGADGSLLLNDDEIHRRDNRGLGEYYSFIKKIYSSYKLFDIGAADLIYFAANHAIVTCPGGPKVRTVVGRKDSSDAAPDGLLPPGFGPGADHDSLLQLFRDKGFSAEDLAALVGAHTTSRNIAQGEIPRGASQDSTPGKWDVKYYSQTYDPPQGVFRFESDINLSRKGSTVGEHFSGFVNNQGKWNFKFSDAMFRLSVLGIPGSESSKFIDCTDALPRGTSLKRDIKGAPINDRAV